MRQAECRNTDDPDAFFAEKGESLRRLEALKLCMVCPVRQACEDYRNRVDDQYGIWGGKLQKRNSGPGE